MTSPRKKPGKPTRRQAPPRWDTRALPQAITEPLRKVARRHLAIQWRECAVLLAGLLPGCWLAQGLADWIFDLPWAVRLILLALDVALAAYVLHRYALTPWKNRLGAEYAALKIEQEISSFHSALISLLQLSHASQGAPALLGKLTETVTAEIRRQGGSLPKKVVSAARLRRWTPPAFLILLIFSTALWFFWPKSGTLLRRIALSHEPLPTRTVVVAVTQNTSAPIGADITLSAKAEGVIPRNGRVQLVYADGKRQDIPVSGTVNEPAHFSVTLKNIQQSFHYRFFLNDGSGSSFSVTAQVPPVLASLGGLQEYPPYLKLPDARMAAGNFSLMAGSTVRIQGEATQALQSANLQIEGANQIVPLKVSGKSISGEFKVPKDGVTGFSVAMVNQDGVPSQGNTVYHVEFVPDKPPTVEMSSPSNMQMSVLAGAKIRLIYKADDDHGIDRIVLKYEIMTPEGNGTSTSQPPAPAKEIPLPGPASASSASPPAQPGAPLSFIWDIATVQPPWPLGTSVRYWIEARDNNDVTGPGRTETPHKTLKVVSTEEKNAEMLETLTNIASELDKVYNTQKKANEILDSTIRKSQP
jgi:hypothetical protein